MALITALLATALASSVAVEMMDQQQIDTRRTENLLRQDQAQLYLLGTESWARGLLVRDAAIDAVDALGDSWANVLPPITLEGGVIAGRIVDEQGRFNLNNLLADGDVSLPDLERFQRLLQNLDIDPAVASALLDWMDEDLEPRAPDGAEDGEYLLLDPPFRAANRPLSSASELRLVAGMDETSYRRLGPFVTALPERTAINVNTAPPEILRALAEIIGKTGAEALVDRRGRKGFESVEAFLADPALAGAGDRVAPAALSVASGYFRLESEVRIGRVTMRLSSLLRRRGEVVVLRRSHGDL